jgi:WD40 repeat protein/serine/threonine protein kinase
MEYVDGTDLGHLLHRQGPLAIPQACDYIRQAANGLAHAHERSLVHRDIKPSNLLLTYAEGLVKVLDLGLARLHESVGQSGSLTGTGVIMGTPDFMSPEQGRDSRRVDARSDLYSLGCTLYYLLTKAVPFPGGSVTEKLLRHIMETPRPLVELRSEVPAKLAAVVEKLMAKQPEERYKTAAQVVEALAPFAAAPRSAEQYRPAPQDVGAMSDQEPRTQASPPESRTASYHPSRSASHRPPGSSATDCDATPPEAPTPGAALASVKPRRRKLLAALLLVVLLLGGTLAVVFQGKNETTRPPEQAPAAVVQAPPPAPATQAPVVVPAAAVQTPTPLAETTPSPPQHEVKIASAPAETVSPQVPTTVRIVPSEPRPGLGVLVHFDRPQQASALRTALSPNGEWAVASIDCKIHLWHVPLAKRDDRASETLGVSHPPAGLAVLGDGSRILIGRPADDPHTPLDRVPPVLSFASIWDPLVSRHEHLLAGFKSDAVTCVALSAKGNFALSGGADRSVRLWDLGNGTLKASLGTHEQRVSCVAYSADGRLGLSGGWDGQVILWDLENGTKRTVLRRHTNIVTSVAFAPDGRHAVSAGFDGTLYLYDLEKQQFIRSFEGHTDAVKSVAFAPNSEQFLSGSADRTVRLWNIHVNEHVQCIDDHNVAVLSVAVSADGKYGVFICADQTIRRCELHP